MNKSHTLRLVLAFLCMALFVGALGLHFWASREPLPDQEAILEYSVAAAFVSGLLMMLAAMWATPKEKRGAARQLADPLVPGSAPGPVLREIHWLKRNPQTERVLRRIVPLGYASMIGAIATMSYFYYVLAFGSEEGMSPEKVNRLTELKIQYFIVALMMTGVPFFCHIAVRSMRHQLGTDGRNLYVKLTEGRQLSLAPEQLVYDMRRIAYRDYVFPVGTGNRQALYESGEVATYLAPLLSRAKQLTPPALMRYQFEHREPMAVVTGVFGIVVLVAIIAHGMWKLLL